MRQFTAGGKVWDIPTIDLPMCRDVRQALQLNLSRQEDFERLIDDPLLAVDVLQVLCKKQIDARTMTAKEFDLVFDGDGLEAARDALVRAVVDFFPKPRREAFEKLFTMAARKTKTAQDRMDQIDPEPADLESLATLNGSVGSSPGN